MVRARSAASASQGAELRGLLGLLVGCVAPGDPPEEWRPPLSPEQHERVLWRAGGAHARVTLRIQDAEGKPTLVPIWLEDCPREREMFTLRGDAAPEIEAALGTCILAAYRKDGGAHAWTEDVVVHVDDPRATYEALLQLPPGEFGGPGFGIEESGSDFVLRFVQPGSEVAEYRVKPDDRLVEVDGLAVSGRRLPDVERALFGPLGTRVPVAIESSGKRLRLDLERVRIR